MEKSESQRTLGCLKTDQAVCLENKGKFGHNVLSDYSKVISKKKMTAISQGTSGGIGNTLL